MSEHTPGPWSTNGSHVYAPDGAVIAVVNNPGIRSSDYPLVPNRNLMAAAPELLEALSEVTSVLQYALLCTTAEIAKDGMAFVRKAKAAIAKAQGEPS